MSMTCNITDPNCILPGNPEYWPIIGGLVTELTDVVGIFYPSAQGCQNGWFGLALLVALTAGAGYLLKDTKEGKAIISKVTRIVK